MVKTHLEYLPRESNVGEFSLFIFIQPNKISSAENLSRWDAQRVGRPLPGALTVQWKPFHKMWFSPQMCVWGCLCQYLYISFKIRHRFEYCQICAYMMGQSCFIFQILIILHSHCDRLWNDLFRHQYFPCLETATMTTVDFALSFNSSCWWYIFL